MSSCDILNMEWSSQGRDTDIVEPVLVSLELKYGLRIVREGLADWEWKLLKYRPRMLLISNTIGAPENANLIKMASKLGILTVSLVSEGDYAETESAVIATFWGWNKDKIVYENLHMEWTQRTIDLIRKYVPEAATADIGLSGATGFDRYKLLTFMDKGALLGKYGKSEFRKAVVLIGWGFDHFFGDYWAKFESVLRDSFTPREIGIFQDSLARQRAIYEALITENPDILFILKHHPGIVDKTLSEFYGLAGRANTLEIHREENIADILNASDFAVAFESTTALEAWLLGKQSMLVNPAGSDFNRSKLAQGSPIFADLESVRAAFAGFYATGSIPGFRELEPKRGRIIEGIIGWADGKNHLRARDHIYRVWTEGAAKRSLDAYVIRGIAAGLAKSVIRKTPILKSLLRRKVGHLARFDELFVRSQRKERTEKYRKALPAFYAAHGDGAGAVP